MLNQCNFIGRLGQDPEVRYSGQGTAFCNISIGCSEKWKDKQTGEQKERTEWVKCVAGGRLAEIMGEYIKKGSLVYISGKMTTRKWQDQSGQDRYSTEIRVSEMKMLDSKSSNGQATNQGQQSNQTQQRPQSSSNHQAAPQYNDAPHDFDDDIPF